MNRKPQLGFTLVEIVVVLAIAGLLVTGALTGKALINNARVKSLAQDFNSSPLYVYGYASANVLGGKIFVTNNAQSPITGLTGVNVVCSDMIPGAIAKHLDTILDDENTASGKMMVVPAGTTAQTPPLANSDINDSSTYLVCMGI